MHRFTKYKMQKLAYLMSQLSVSEQPELIISPLKACVLMGLKVSLSALSGEALSGYSLQESRSEGLCVEIGSN